MSFVVVVVVVMTVYSDEEEDSDEEPDEWGKFLHLKEKVCSVDQIHADPGVNSTKKYKCTLQVRPLFLHTYNGIMYMYEHSAVVTIYTCNSFIELALVVL